MGCDAIVSIFIPLARIKKMLENSALDTQLFYNHMKKTNKQMYIFSASRFFAYISCLLLITLTYMMPHVLRHNFLYQAPLKCLNNISFDLHLSGHI